MIDIEIDIFDMVYPYVSPLVPEGGFVNEFVPAPASLPHVYLSEIDNVPDTRTADSGGKEYSCILTYEAQVYARTKQECRDIQVALDSALVGALGFEKISSNQVPNLDDTTIYRFVSRYRRGITHSGALYRA